MLDKKHQGKKLRDLSKYKVIRLQRLNNET
jgi:hypothetical protein